MTLSQTQQPSQTVGRERLILLVHAFVSWALCTAAMMIPMALVSVEFALVVHATVAPIFAGIISRACNRNHGYTTPLQTALTFVGFVIVVDFFLVAAVIERGFEMFTSPLGTWISFASVFLATYLMGRWVESRHGDTA
jgi:hypothetical protein